MRVPYPIVSRPILALKSSRNAFFAPTLNRACPDPGPTTLAISAGAADPLTTTMAQQSSTSKTANGQLPAAADYPASYRRPDPQEDHRWCRVFPGVCVGSDSSYTPHPRRPSAHHNFNSKHPMPSPFERLPAELLIRIGSYIAAGPDATGLCSFRLCNRRAARAAHSSFAETFFKDLVVMRQASSLYMLDEISRSDFREMVTRVAVDVAMLPTVATRPVAPDREAVLNIESRRQYKMIREGHDMKLLTAALLRFPNLHTLGVQHLGILRQDLSICLCAPWGILASRSLRQVTDLCPHDATASRLGGREPVDRTPSGGNPWTSFDPPPDSGEILQAQGEACICIQALLAAVSAAGLRPKTLEILSGTFGPLGHEIFCWPRGVTQPIPLLNSIRELRLSLRRLKAYRVPVSNWLTHAKGLRSLHLDLGSSTDQRTGGVLSFLSPPLGMMQPPPIQGLPPITLFPWIPLAELTLSRASLDVDKLIALVRHFGPTLQRLELDRITLHHRLAAHQTAIPPASRNLLPHLLAAVAPVARGWASFRLSHIAHSGPQRQRPPPPPHAGGPGPFPPQGYVFIAPGGHYKTISYSGPRPCAALRCIRESIVASTPWVPDPEARWEGGDRWEGSWDTWVSACKCEGCASMVYIHIRPGDPESYPVDMDLS
ncbi:hypothetical protein RB595_002250 [Gaeumannomyces hyphopodioides]